MARIEVAGAAAVEEDYVLKTGRYNLDIRDMPVVHDRDGRLSLQVNLYVTGGPVQDNGADPEGEVRLIFFPLNGYESMSDDGKFVKKKIKNFIQASGIDFEVVGDNIAFDYEDLQGVSLIGINRTQKDKLTGEPTENWTSFHPEA